LGSATHHGAIVATVITLVFVPVVDKTHHLVGHRMVKRTHTMRCVAGKPIPATPLAKRLGIAGKSCKKQIVRRVRVEPTPRTVR
jgi:hypothetical protein